MSYICRYKKSQNYAPQKNSADTRDLTLFSNTVLIGIRECCQIHNSSAGRHYSGIGTLVLKLLIVVIDICSKISTKKYTCQSFLLYIY